MNITLNNTGLTLTDSEMVELRKFAVLHSLSGKFYLAADEDGGVFCYTHMPYMAYTEWSNTNCTTFRYIIKNSKTECGTWDESLTIVNVNQLLSGVPEGKPDDGWYYIEDDVYPEHKQHVIVWDLRDNVCYGNGDNDKGQVQGGDCFYSDAKIDWDDLSDAHKARWKDYDDYQSMNGSRHRWSGQGPCSFGEVVAWRPFPTMPSRLEK